MGQSTLLLFESRATDNRQIERVYALKVSDLVTAPEYTNERLNLDWDIKKLKRVATIGRNWLRLKIFLKNVGFEMVPRPETITFPEDSGLDMKYLGLFEGDYAGRIYDLFFKEQKIGEIYGHIWVCLYPKAWLEKACAKWMMKIFQKYSKLLG